MIIIVIVFNSLYKDFDMTIASLLETSDKIIDQIQNISQSKEVKNLSKQATRDTRDLAMAFRDKGPKTKARSDDEYYICYKLRYFGQDYFLPDRRPNKITQ